MARKPDTPCVDCGKLLWGGTTSLPAGERRCQPCRAKRRVERGGNHRATEQCTCPVCGDLFRPCKTSRTESGWTEICSPFCVNVRHAELYGVEVDLGVRSGSNAEKMRRKKAIKRAAFVEKVDRKVVFERDNWICHICGEPVDKTLSGRDRMGPTIDHVIPYSQGGKDCYDNVALAHQACNSRKWVRLEAGDYAYGPQETNLQESGL